MTQKATLAFNPNELFRLTILRIIGTTLAFTFYKEWQRKGCMMSTQNGQHPETKEMRTLPCCDNDR